MTRDLDTFTPRKEPKLGLPTSKLLSAGKSPRSPYNIWQKAETPSLARKNSSIF